MTETNKTKKVNVKKLSIIIAIALVAVAAAVVCIVMAQKNYLATTMRLLRIEGSVTVEDSKGGAKPLVDNMRFQSGDALSTGSNGLASVGLDDTKIVTLNADSRAEFVKKGKQLELKLTKGAVFFNVTEKLRSDETFEIKTSTMTAGIRGTSGIVYYDENAGGRETIAITDRAVEISATNPDTGETKTARLEAGNMLTVYLFSGRIENSVEFDINEIAEYEIPGFALERITENKDLMKKVCDHTGWNEAKLRKALSDLDNTDIQPTESETSATSSSGTLPPETSDNEQPSDTSAAPSKKRKKRPTKKPTRRPTKKPRSKKKKTTATSKTSVSDPSVH